jgi:hypothetical protein
MVYTVIAIALEAKTLVWDVAEILVPVLCGFSLILNPLEMKHRLLFLKTQFVPRSKHFSSWL